MTSKQCLRCSTVRPLDAFAKNRRKKDGLEIYCRKCVASASAAHYVKNRGRRVEQGKAWLAANPGASAAYSKAWREKNPGAQSASERRWYEKNRERALEADRVQRLAKIDEAQARDRARYWKIRDKKLRRMKAWREANPSTVAAYAAARRAAKRQRTPVWLTDEDWAAIVAVYERCRLLSAETGVPHHVDHVVPLQGRGVCGLHVTWNLQCLPAAVNLSKNNRLLP